jgi:hypothetical protein
MSTILLNFIRRQKLATACIIFAFASAITTIVLIALVAIALNDNSATASAFSSIANNCTSRIETRLSNTLVELQVVGGLFYVTNTVSSVTFDEFLQSTPLVDTQNAIGWAEAVPDSEVDEFIARVEQEVRIRKFSSPPCVKMLFHRTAEITLCTQFRAATMTREFDCRSSISILAARTFRCLASTFFQSTPAVVGLILFTHVHVVRREESQLNELMQHMRLLPRACWLGQRIVRECGAWWRRRFS